MNKIEFITVTEDMVGSQELVETLNKNFQTIKDSLEKRDKYMFKEFQKVRNKMDKHHTETQNLLTQILRSVNPNPNNPQILTDQEN